MALLALAAALLVLPGRRRVVMQVTSPASGVARQRGWRAVGLGAVVVAAALALPPTAVAAVVIVGGTAVVRSRRAVRRAQRSAEAAALRGALDVLAGELRAGAHPVAAFEAAAQEATGDVATALRSVAARARLGVDVASGLRDAAATSTVPGYWTRLGVCWELAHRHGLAIAVLVRTAHREFVARERFESQFAAGMAGARATALVLAGLPVLGIGLGQLIGADPVRFLLSDGFGGLLLTIGTAFACAGLAWSDRITAGVSK